MDFHFPAAFYFFALCKIVLYSYTIFTQKGDVTPTSYYNKEKRRGDDALYLLCGR